MAFTQVHDAWIREGLRDATFSLQVVPAGKGSAQWGCKEGVPVDVYCCDFFQYDPPDDFPRHDVCCIRTDAAWWILFTESMHTRLQTLAQDGELIRGLYQTITTINERQIGAWLLVRDQGMSGEQALTWMDRHLAKRDGESMRDKITLKPWEQDAFTWVDHNVDPRSGKTRRQKRDEAMREKSDGKA